MSRENGNSASAILRIVPKNSEEEPNYRGIEKSLMSIPGVSHVRINHMASTVAVDYDPQIVKLEAIREKLRNH